MKLSEIRGEAAIDALADILEPVSEILADTEFRDAVRAKKPHIELVKMALKKHKKQVIEILAVLDSEDPKTYSPSILTLPIKLLEVFNDKELIDLFTSQDQMNQLESFGPAMGNTEVSEN